MGDTTGEIKKYGKGQHPNSKGNLKPVKKGEPSRNPFGARLHSPEARAMRKLNTEALQEIINIASYGTIEDLRRAANDEKRTAIEVAVARVLVKGINESNWDIVEKLLARAMGKVPDKIDHTSNGQTLSNPPPVTINFVDNDKPEST